MLIGLLGVWLGIFGPLPMGVSNWLHHWQSLIAATIASTIASIAAYVAFQNTSRSLVHAEGMEKNRRERKHAAVRAVLPLALSQVNSYAANSAQSLNELVSKCDGETLPHGTATDSLIQILAPEALETLTDFIEFTDRGSLEVLEATVAWIQIHESRMRSLVQDNTAPSTSRLVLRNELEGRIIDSASIYAGASIYYNYARRRETDLPILLTWDKVRDALRNMRFWAEEHPRLYEMIERREKVSSGPFQTLTGRPWWIR
ncbi:hypothetical protein KMZ29_14730 [Bradyrhizobium sediminis]|uniref:DUF4760 domain-containing protein n=1 Tax=Bradyrhizobium sediminis TaxID=2840469 RepID=A0A975NAN0_9BRAD|nr:hypothetical protein [Bradyrhizobium sediminis]QWG11034.1 hypothetical protein KMZ29_14730 [Bradyrhizobium sediminis]